MRLRTRLAGGYRSCRSGRAPSPSWVREPVAGGLIHGRYNDPVQGSESDETERVDVLVARDVPTVDGVRVEFDEVWRRRRALDVAAGVTIAVPALDDLILTKRFGGRPKDLEDIRLLEALRKEEA
jgi:hypothetical protein